MANVDNYIILCFIVATAILLAIKFIGDRLLIGWLIYPRNSLRRIPISIRKNTVVRRGSEKNDLLLVQLKFSQTNNLLEDWTE